MYGEPGDYAWGPGGLDAIITQVRTLSLILRLCHILSSLAFEMVCERKA